MKKQYSFLGYLLVGFGLYFLLRELKIPILTDFYSWTTLLIILGVVLLVHGYKSSDFNNLFAGTFLLGLGIHFHGLRHYSFWIEHWAVYLLLIGIAFIVRSLKSKKGLLLGISLSSLAILMIFSTKLPDTFPWVYDIIHIIDRFWPIALIIIGIYFIKSKK
ncbi:LiaI-LiaF-like domain-containing protein [Ornithinibacillus halophilus]|uniref:LiaF transmembrane domain-containing protein n=1 Tax=Ornithinibacillus halophilus TaxID=930117 RepID=A0A1M5DCT8_9BACI|nr:DUF5668 domain-containing protein [Ornithinibacillus halophilus]SHF64746.1 hypothetical protein SAMN05216225_10021 [Ornithinibacillus halophilus]